MALSSTPSPSICLPLKKCTPSGNGPSSVSYLSSSFGRQRRPISVRATSAPSAVASESFKPAISLTDNALKHLNKMRSERKADLCLRIGVKQGGCSGMSYLMDFEDQANMRPDDSVIEYDGFVIVCDPKSLLFIYGMQLDFSDALIGGGFSFKNPNATQTCGCGKSFAA
ncbi:iron-sulfur assembly protein IscA, chloroplastic [Nymphaea colorata]|nr:iron-sulfur assembly protein IscA, chloroplastic [Nymphaea colorata]